MSEELKLVPKEVSQEGLSATESRHEQVLHDLRADLTRQMVAMAQEGKTH